MRSTSRRRHGQESRRQGHHFWCRARCRHRRLLRPRIRVLPRHCLRHRSFGCHPRLRSLSCARSLCPRHSLLAMREAQGTATPQRMLMYSSWQGFAVSRQPTRVLSQDRGASLPRKSQEILDHRLQVRVELRKQDRRHCRPERNPLRALCYGICTDHLQQGKRRRRT